MAKRDGSHRNGRKPPGSTEADRDEERLVHVDGLSIRRLRHERGLSPRDLVDAIAEARFVESGLRETITPNQLCGVEERGERVPIRIVRLIAGGLECDLSDILP